jgi:hypothetical protein
VNVYESERERNESFAGNFAASEQQRLFFEVPVSESHAELRPHVVALAKRLYRQKPKGGRMSLRQISAKLAAQGFLNENGRAFAAASIKSMLD